jgi:pyruvate kinase
VGQLSLLWGVLPVKVPKQPTEEALIAASLEAARGLGLAQAGDLVVVTSGQAGVTGTTDQVKVRVVP